MFISRGGMFLAALMVAALPVTLAVTLYPGRVNAQEAKCPDFPKVVWWHGLSHETTITFVNKRHDGDWQPLIKAWQNNLDKLQAIQKKGSVASIKYKSFIPGLGVETRKIRLSGAKLEAYIQNVWKRIAVTYCLSDFKTAGQATNDG